MNLQHALAGQAAFFTFNAKMTMSPYAPDDLKDRYHECFLDGFIRQQKPDGTYEYVHILTQEGLDLAAEQREAGGYEADWWPSCQPFQEVLEYFATTFKTVKVENIAGFPAKYSRSVKDLLKCELEGRADARRAANGGIDPDTAWEPKTPRKKRQSAGGHGSFDSRNRGNEDGPPSPDGGEEPSPSGKGKGKGRAQTPPVPDNENEDDDLEFEQSSGPKPSDHEKPPDDGESSTQRESDEQGYDWTEPRREKLTFAHVAQRVQDEPSWMPTWNNAYFCLATSEKSKITRLVKARPGMSNWVPPKQTPRKFLFNKG